MSRPEAPASSRGRKASPGAAIRYLAPRLSEPGSNSVVKQAGLVAGPVLAVLVYLLLPSERAHAGGLADAARVVAGVTVLMGVWWMTEALPLEVTGLVPLVLIPPLTPVKMGEVAVGYADKVIFLFLGGMLLGAAMERWDLHRRLALAVLRATGGGAARLVGGFLFATAFISMWVSNTAAAVLMLPIAVSVGRLVSTRVCEGHREEGIAGRCSQFRTALVLAVAFGASIGGVGTLIGTPPTAQFAAFMDQAYGRRVSFLGWMLLGLPIVGVVLLAAWLVLTRLAFRVKLPVPPGLGAYLDEETRELGPMNRGQVGVLAVCGLAAAGWVSSRWTGIPDESIAIGAAVLLFLIPVGKERGGFVLTWDEAQRVPWGVLLLFGGGLSLANCMTLTRLDVWLAGRAEGLAGVPLLAVLLLLAACATAMTEFATNTALVALALPIVAAIAKDLGAEPSLLLVTATLAASLGFMLPAGTAPNALAYATGEVTMRQMMRAGLYLDVFCALLVPLVVLAAMKLGMLPGAG